MAHHMTARLRALYQSHWGRIRSVRHRVNGGRPYGPFLLGYVEPFVSQPVRLMVIGQQTKEWSNHDDIDRQMEAHEQLGNGREYRRIFHNTARRMEESLGIASYSCIYANLSRFDVGGDKPVGLDAEAISELDFLLAEEVAILKPDVCLFFTGPTLDDRVGRAFPGLERVKVGTWPERQLCRLGHPTLPRRTFRTYHPVSLRRQDLERRVLGVLDKLIGV